MRKKNPSTKWSQHLSDPKDKERFIEYINSCVEIRSRLSDILESMKKTSKQEDYDSPSWSHKQADQNGYNRAIEEIIKIVSVD